MANKERNKRSARQARAAERERKAAAQAQAAPAEDKSKKSLFSRASSGEKDDSGASKSSSKSKDKQIEKKKPGRVRTYLHDVRTEMKRVVWPSPQELRSYTVAVIIMLIVSGVVLWAVDTGIVSLVLGYTGLRG